MNKQKNNNNTYLCEKCNFKLKENYVACPKCGRKVKNKEINSNKKIIIISTILMISIFLITFVSIFCSFFQDKTYKLKFSDIYNYCDGNFDECNITKFLNSKINNNIFTNNKIMEEIQFTLDKNEYEVKVKKSFLFITKNKDISFVVEDDRGPFILKKVENCSITEGELFLFTNCYEVYDFNDKIVNIDNITFNEKNYNENKADEYQIDIKMRDSDNNVALDKFKLNVKKSDIKLDISKNKSVGVGKTITYQYTMTPNNGYDTSIEWSSSNTNVATIENNGKVIGVSAGTTTICAYSKYYDVKECSEHKVTKSQSQTSTVKPSNGNLNFSVEWNGFTTNTTTVRVIIKNTTNLRKKGMYKVYAYIDGIRYGESGNYVYDVLADETVVENSVNIYGIKCSQNTCTYKVIEN